MTLTASTDIPMTSIIVSQHAGDAYRQRLNDTRHWRVIANEITDLIEQGIRDGRVFTGMRPEGFTLYGRRHSRIPEGQRFVQVDDRFGFMLKTIEGGDEIVTTLLTRTGVRR